MTPDPLSSDFDPLAEPAEEFMTRYRRGERPALAEYEARFPALAGRIRIVFPAMVEMERVGDSPTGPVAVVPDHPVTAGDGVPPQIGEFRILRKVGEGGMGVVYEAVQESLGRHVALKVLPPNRTGTYLERFRREARAAARLHHTNIVPVFGVGEADGLHFYAMQFIPGQGLDTVLDEVRRLRGTKTSQGGPSPTMARSVAEGLLTGTFPPADTRPDALPPAQPPASTDVRSELANQPEARYYREVARIGMQVAEALTYAHGQGVLHRDIKPSNLLLDLGGTVWVTDFGLSKADDEADLTQTGDIVGTLRYMAPERFRGTADARSEVYALGVTLYELLTLRPAFAGSDRVALLEQVCHTAPARPRRLDGHIPRDLETVVLKAIAREPADRYPSAAALADDLRRFLTDRSITARRASAVEQLRRWARRNKAVASLLGFILLAAVSAAVVFGLQSSRLRVALKESEDDRLEATRSQRDTQFKRLDSMIAEARATILGRKPGQRFASLARLDEAAALARELGVLPEKTADLRNAVAAALAMPDLHIGRAWDGHPPGSLLVDITGDHTVYARTQEDGFCVVARAADNTEVCRVPLPPVVADQACLVHLSGDGRTLLLLQVRGEAHVWRLDAPPVRVAGTADAHRADIRPDDRLAAVTHTDGSVSLFELPDGRPAGRLTPTKPGERVVPVLHPSKPQILQLAYDQALAVVRDTGSGKEIARLTDFRPVSAAWHPSGAALVVASDDNTLRVYDGKTFRVMAVWPTIGAFAVVRFNPSGDRLAGVTWDMQAAVIDTHAGRTLFVSPPFRDGLALRWDATGRRLAGPVVQGRLGIWEVGDGREFRVLHRLPAPTPTGVYLRVAVHPGGRLVAAAAGAGVTLWDVETGRQVADLPAASFPGQPVFDPAGRLWVPDEKGTLRWQVREAVDHPGRFTIGPPERVPIDPGALARSADATVWVGADRYRADAFVWRPDRPYDRGSIPVGEERLHVDLSPDGRWLVTSLHTTDLAELWDVPARARVRRLATHCGNGVPAFSPDGTWLWSSADGGRLLRVGTWEPGPATGRAEGRPAFTADGRLIALESGAGSVRIMETATGRELVRLDNPHQDPLYTLAFTPDGGRLVGSSRGSAPGVHVWNLHLIRRQLADRGLDWDAPPVPPPSATPAPVEARVPITTPAAPPPKGEEPLVTVSRMTAYLVHDPELAAPHHYRAHALERLGMAGRAEADFDEAVRLAPGDPDVRGCRARLRFARGRYAEAAADLDRVLADAPVRPPPVDLLNKLSVWYLVLAPAGQRNPAKGLDFTRRSVAHDPKDAMSHFALGVALLRSGRPKEAVTKLNQVVAVGPGQYDDLVYPALVLGNMALGDSTRAAEALRLGSEAAARLSKQRHPEYLRLARDHLIAEATAAYLSAALPTPWPFPR
jgi:serine/threonine protein kinase/WD40 repeat protein/tetratricopeptide (TPR) repeat protein